jgi:hypothetical protein
MFLGTKPEESSSQDKPTSCNTVKTEINGSTNHEFSNGEYSYKLALIVEINFFFLNILLKEKSGVTIVFLFHGLLLVRMFLGRDV